VLLAQSVQRVLVDTFLPKLAQLQMLTLFLAL
jgi:hypothetical protein